MIKREEGIINGIVYDNTVYHNGEYRFYPSIMDFKHLVKKIIASQTTTEYIKCSPFYINAKLDRQVEFDKFMFYMECREEFDNATLEEFLQECEEKQLEEMSSDEIRCAKIQYVLCEYTNVKRFRESLEAYILYLNEIIPKMVEELKSEYKIKDDDLMFGYFCFEVDSE